LDRITGALSVSKCFGKSAAEDINPMRDVSLTGVVIPDEYHRFITRGTRYVIHMDQQELMVQHPICFDSILNRLSSYFASQLPISKQILDQVVAEYAIGSIKRFLSGELHYIREDRRQQKHSTKEEPFSHFDLTP
jgi:hypothetical protein